MSIPTRPLSWIAAGALAGWAWCRGEAPHGAAPLAFPVRVAGGVIRVVTPRPRTTRGSPFGPGVEWLALEERFTFYGGGIALIGTSLPSTQPTVADPATPVNGPFSADFKWATLPDISSTPIRFTDGQAKVFEALWSFKGEATTAERIMQRAGLDSAKPSDLFKIKSKDKGKPEPAAQHAAYQLMRDVPAGSKADATRLHGALVPANSHVGPRHCGAGRSACWISAATRHSRSAFARSADSA